VDGIVVKLGANGRLTFDPGDTYDNLSAGETLQREFTYAVGNGSGHLASATVKLTIRGRNDAPVTVSDAASTDEGTTLTIAASTLLSNDSDIDRLDVLAVSAVAATANTHGTVILDNGQITYTPEAGYSGPAYFSYTVSDGQGGTATGTVNVEVLTPAAGFAHTVRVVDPNGLATDQYEELVSNLSAAVNNWARYITGQGSIDIDLVITQENANASAASTTNTPIGTFEGKTLVRDSVPHELMTGEDLNGAAADGTVFVPIGYLQTFLWLDPNPAGRTDPVPGDKTDGLSVFMHEFGHVLGMTGFGEPDGTLTGETASVYDSLITFMGDNAFFSGQTAASVFGGPVPLSNPNRGNQNNYAHYGRETSDGLDANLMEGNTFFFNGTRYDIEQIDLAIMRDMGLSVGDQWLIA
jgi:VCBS repeat-containing protein